MGAAEDEEVPGGMDMYEAKKGGKDWHATGKKAGQKGAHDKDTDYSGHGERKDDESDTDPGDKDHTWRKGGESKSHPGKLNKESQQLNELGPEAVEVASQVAQMMGDPGALAAAVAASPVLGALLDKLSNAMADSKVQAAVAASGAGEEEELSMDVAAINEDDIVAEVSRRVAARLQADKKREEVASQLAERIFDRLTSK